MLRKINKKGAELATNKIIVIVLCLIVLAAVLLYVFRARVNEWIQNLPAYGSQEDKEITVTGEGQVGTSTCEFVGRVIDKGADFPIIGAKYAIIYIRKGTVDIKTELLWYYNRADGPILLGGLSGDYIGHAGLESTATRVISIESSAYASALVARMGLASIDDLKKLDGAIIQKDNKICKPK
jgi:hypothetical protein